MSKPVSQKIIEMCQLAKADLETDNTDTVNAIENGISSDDKSSIFNSRFRLNHDIDFNNVVDDITDPAFICTTVHYRTNDYQIVIEKATDTAIIFLSDSAMQSAKQRYSHFFWRLCGAINEGGDARGQGNLFNNHDQRVEGSMDEKLAERIFGNIFDKINQLLVYTYTNQAGVVNAFLQKYDRQRTLLWELEIKSDNNQGVNENLNVSTPDTPNGNLNEDIPLKVRQSKDKNDKENQSKK